MAKAQKIVCWTVLYVDRTIEDDWTATGFAYARSAEEAKARFLRDMELTNGVSKEMFPVLRVFKGVPF